MTRLLVPLAAFALLAGCSTGRPRPAVAPDVPPLYPAFRPSTTDAPAGPQAVDISWQGMFGDPRLRALIATALENNRDLRIATGRIAEAAALRRIARADRFPTIDAGASALRRGGDPGAGNAQGGGDPGTGNPGSGDAIPSGGFGRSGVQVDVGVSAFELDFWGRVRNLDRAALATYFATTEARAAFRLSLIAEIADTYLTERELAERARIADATIAAREEGLRIARRLFEEGEGSDFEVRGERALLAEARAARADIANQSAAAGNLLRLLIGGAPPADLPPPLRLVEQRIVEDIAPGLPSELLLRRPDIREGEALLLAADANLAAARAALFPTVALTGSAGLASSDLAGLFDAGTFIWSVAANAFQTIFDSGRRRSRIDADFARQQIALADYERRIQAAFREVADALAARRFLLEQRRAQADSLAAQTRRLQLAQLRFQAGESGAIDVLEARRTIFAAEQQLVSTRRAELANAVQLYVALGGHEPPRSREVRP